MVIGMQHKKRTMVPVAKPLLTADELGAATGLTMGQLYRWASEGRFPVQFIFKIGRRTYFKRGLIDWLAGGDGTGPTSE
jgi:predicted DNA-binding transcriptional regulator AlpA